MVALLQYCAQNAWVLVKQWFCPLLLLAQAAMSVYFVDFCLGWSFFLEPAVACLSVPAPRPALLFPFCGWRQIFSGVLLITSNSLLLGGWFLPWMYCLVMGWIVPRFRKLHVPPFGEVYQMSPETRSRRYCRRCRAMMGDRTYHCNELGRCLRRFDHTCFWMACPIYLDNVKAYITFCTFLPAHQLFTVVVGVTALCNGRIAQSGWLWSVFALGITIWYAMYEFRAQWLYQMIRNSTLQEMLAVSTYMYAGGATYTYSIRASEMDPLSGNPWDFGERENVRSLLGPYWSWFFFWMSTPLMEQPEFPNRIQLVDGEVFLVDPPRYRSWFTRFLEWYRPLDALKDRLARLRTCFIRSPPQPLEIVPLQEVVVASAVEMNEVEVLPRRRRGVRSDPSDARLPTRLAGTRTDP